MNIPSPPSPRCPTKVHFYRLFAFLCVSKQELFSLKPKLFSVQVAAALAQSCHRETDSGLLQSVVLRINSWCVVRLQAEVENKKKHTHIQQFCRFFSFWLLFSLTSAKGAGSATADSESGVTRVGFTARIISEVTFGFEPLFYFFFSFFILFFFTFGAF